MSHHVTVKAPLITWRTVILMALMAAGAAAALYRFAYGLGASTGMSNIWPWGLWKGFNVLCLITLGAGGFTSAALIYLFGGERYHAWARPTALWGLLCYSFAGGSLVVDISVPWRIVHPIWMWPEHSILFEVAWCVMLYISVLSLEVAPGVFERFNLNGLADLWRKLVPVYAVAALSFFAYIMSHSFAWAGAALVLFSLIALFSERVKHKPSTPILLIMFGVVLSTLHQSSLGSLFLLIPDKLSHFWWSPRLPFNFYFSAIAMGFSMLIIERTITSRLWKFPRPDDRLERLSLVALAATLFYLSFRLVDVVAMIASAGEFGGFSAAFGGGSQAALFVTEIFLGGVVPVLLLASRAGRQNPTVRLVATSLVSLGVWFNRLNATFLGWKIDGPAYTPTLIEITISLATVAAIIFLFDMGMKFLPMLEAEPVRRPEPTGGGTAASRA